MLAIRTVCRYTKRLLLCPVFFVVIEGKQEWDTLKGQIQNLRDNLVMVREQERRTKTKADVLRLYILDRRIDRLTNILNNLDTLDRSKHRYCIKNESRNGISYTSYDSASNALVFHIGMMNGPSFAHETTHGIQFERGEMVFHKNGAGLGIGDDIDDELEAYKNQLAVQLSTIGQDNINEEITAGWLFQLKDSSGRYVYNVLPIYPGNENTLIGLSPININSGPDDLKRAFPTLSTVWPAKYPLQDTTLFYFTSPH